MSSGKIEDSDCTSDPIQETELPQCIGMLALLPTLVAFAVASRTGRGILLAIAFGEEITTVALILDFVALAAASVGDRQDVAVEAKESAFHRLSLVGWSVVRLVLVYPLCTSVVNRNPGIFPLRRGETASGEAFAVAFGYTPQEFLTEIEREASRS